MNSPIIDIPDLEISRDSSDGEDIDVSSENAEADLRSNTEAEEELFNLLGFDNELSKTIEPTSVVAVDTNSKPDAYKNPLNKTLFVGGGVTGIAAIIIAFFAQANNIVKESSNPSKPQPAQSTNPLPNQPANEAELAAVKAQLAAGKQLQVNENPSPTPTPTLSSTPTPRPTATSTPVASTPTPTPVASTAAPSVPVKPVVQPAAIPSVKPTNDPIDRANPRPVRTATPVRTAEAPSQQPSPRPVRTADTPIVRASPTTVPTSTEAPIARVSPRPVRPVAPVRTAEPPIATASPRPLRPVTPIRTAEPPIDRVSPRPVQPVTPIRTAEPPIATASPKPATPVRAVEPPVATASPTAVRPPTTEAPIATIPPARTTEMQQPQPRTEPETGWQQISTSGTFGGQPSKRILVASASNSPRLGIEPSVPPTNVPSPTPTPTTVAATNSELTPAERQFLQGSAANVQLVPGQKIDGKLSNPIQLNEGGRSQVLIEVDALSDSQNRLVLPAGTQILFDISVAGNGLINAEAKKIFLNGRFVDLPSGMIATQKEDNSPLIAQEINASEDRIAGAEGQNAVYGALGRIGQVLTAPDTQNTISNGVVVSNQTQNRDVLGAVLDGGLNPILRQRQQSAQAEYNRNANRPRVWFLAAGVKVKLTVIQPFTLN
jgi:hypothetical protein